MQHMDNLWNSLSWEVEEADSIARFKPRLDKFMDDKTTELSSDK